MASDWSIDVDGVFKDFNTDLDFLITTSFGTGLPPFINNLSSLALQPGSIFENQKVGQRSLRLQGSIVAEGSDDKTDVHDKRQALIKAIMAYPELINQPVELKTLRYSGATVTKDIQVIFDGGLEDEPPIGWSQEDITIRFIAPDPLFYATSETTTALDVEDSATFETISAKIDGVWDNLGPPNASGNYTSVLAIASDDTYIYIGGQFTNFDNIANADYIARYHKTNQTWSALGTGANNNVNALLVDSNGDLWAGGQFTSMGGVGSTNRIARWNGSSWNAVGSGLNGYTVTGIIQHPDNNIYVSSIHDVSSHAVRKWNGSSWSTLGGNANDAIRDIAFTVGNGYIYVTGDFSSINSVAAAEIAYWDGSAWNAMGSGLGGSSGRSLAVSDDGLVYVGGVFTTAGGNTDCNRVAVWNGTTFNALGAGVDTTSGQVNDVVISPKNEIYALGSYPGIGGDSNLAYAAKWNGSEWTRLDIDLTNDENFVAHWDDENDLYIGHSLEGSTTYAGNTTIAYGGTWVTYPYITISRANDGTSAKLIKITNTLTGSILNFDYDLAKGEEITIQLNPQEGIGVISDILGNRPDAIQANSNSGDFYLTPKNASGSNDNIITVFMELVGSPTITANINYKTAYISLD